jgi:Uma2 family endonuclease
MVSIAKLSKLHRPQKVHTFEEYLLREESAAEKHEFYNGKIIKMPGGTHIHSEIAANLIHLLKTMLRPIARKYRVYSSDLKVYVPSVDIGVYPDALVICETPQFWQNRFDVIVNPLVVVEVLSPRTQAYDRLGKFELYKLLPSFQEYVLVNTDMRAVETRFREEPDLWRIRNHTEAPIDIPLRSLGISIPIDAIYEDIIFPPKK